MTEHLLNARPRSPKFSPIHAKMTATKTMCGWDYQTVINGTTVLLAVPTTRPVNCKRCVQQIREQLRQRLHGLSGTQIERLLDVIETEF